MQRDYDSHMNRGKFPTVFVVLAAAVIAVVVIIIAVFAYFSSRNSYYGNGYYGGYGMMGGFGGFPMMLFMIPIMLIVLVVIGYVIWRGVGWGGGCCGGHYGHYGSDEERETAMEILRRRYARGEITQQQFEQMKKDIVT